LRNTAILGALLGVKEVKEVLTWVKCALCAAFKKLHDIRSLNVKYGGMGFMPVAGLKERAEDSSMPKFELVLKVYAIAEAITAVVGQRVHIILLKKGDRRLFKRHKFEFKELAIVIMASKEADFLGELGHGCLAVH